MIDKFRVPIDSLIKVYYYNNKLILSVNQGISQKCIRNVILGILSPIIGLVFLFCIVYERIYRVRKVELFLKHDLKKNFPVDVAIVSIAKNEGPYIKEWIEYHLIVGVTKFFFYDNDSDDDTESVLKPYIDSKIVIYKKIHGKGKQLTAYNDALQNYKTMCRYMAFIDLDEYIQPMQYGRKIGDIIDELLIRNKKGAAGVAINWAIFGSSKLTEKPQGLITENYIYRADRFFWGNYHIKSIVNPRLVKEYISPHYPLYKLGAYSINECCGERIYGWYNHKVFMKNIRIVHYYTKSKEDYCRKKSRGLGDRIGEYRDSQFDDYDRNEEKDESMRLYCTELRERMQNV